MDAFDLHELAHATVTADRWRQTSVLRDLASRDIEAIERENSGDLRVVEECEDMRRPPLTLDGRFALGRRRLYRVEVIALAIAEIAVPRAAHRKVRCHVAREFAANLRSWGRGGRSIEAVAADVSAAKATPRALRLGAKLRRIVAERGVS